MFRKRVSTKLNNAECPGSSWEAIPFRCTADVENPSLPIEQNFSLSPGSSQASRGLELNSHARKAEACQGNIILDAYIYAPRGGLSRLHPREGSFHWRNGERKGFRPGNRRGNERRERERDEVGEENSNSLREFEGSGRKEGWRERERKKNVEESKGRERKKMGRRGKERVRSGNEKWKLRMRERGEGQAERKIDAIKQEARKCEGEQSGGRLGNRG